MSRWHGLDEMSTLLGCGMEQTCIVLSAGCFCQVLGVIAHYEASLDKYKMDNVILSAKGGDEEHISRDAVGSLIVYLLSGCPISARSLAVLHFIIVKSVQENDFPSLSNQLQA